MYIELIKEFNDKYFFTSKMTAEELQSEIDNPISNIDLDEIARGVVEKMAAETILNTPQGRSLTTPAS